MPTITRRPPGRPQALLMKEGYANVSTEITSPTTEPRTPSALAPTTVEDVRACVSSQGVEFLFAQFVDMHGKPSAKLVPASHLDDLLTDGAGFAGFAAGDVGQQPHDPGSDRHPGSGELRLSAVATERGTSRL